MQKELKWFLDSEQKLRCLTNSNISDDGLVEVTNDVKIAIRLLYNSEKPNLICKRCGNLVIKSTVKGYSFYCPHCDEDLFAFETINKQQQTGDDVIRFLEYFFENEDYHQILNDLEEN